MESLEEVDETILSMTDATYSNFVTFVYIGAKFPSYAIASLEIANETSGARSQLIGNSSIAKSIKKKHAEFIPLEDFYDRDLFSEASRRIASDHSFRDGFWIKSLERFFVLDQFAKYTSQNYVFHAELDQLLFGVNDLVAGIENTQKRGLFLPFHSPTTAVASVLYINDFSALDSLIRYASTGDTFNNEMALIGAWARLNPEKIFALPTPASVEKGSTKVVPEGVETLSTLDLYGTVDAAQIGQWVAGIDPRNLSLRIRPKTKFVDLEADWLLSKDDLTSFRFELSADQSQLHMNNSKGRTRLFNLHLHSKVHRILLSKNFSINKLITLANEQNHHRLRGTRTTQLGWYFKKTYLVLKSDPGRLKVELSWRLNAALKSRPTSKPFISGDTFRSISHHKWENGSKKIKTQMVNAGDIVFCESELFPELCKTVISKLSVRTVVILGNSDKNHFQDDAIGLNSTNSPIVYAQNLVEDISNFKVLPIGIENAWRSKHGRICLKKVLTPKTTNPTYRIMWGFTVGTNPKIRIEALEALKKTDVADRIFEVNPKKHQDLLKQYAFVASPEGNGIDTHRTWEAIYFKCVPIVLRSYMSEYYEQIGLPVWVIDSYEELIGLDESFLNGKYKSLEAKFDTDAVWVDYWFERILESSREISKGV
jgi:hypothetical protein